MTRSLSALRRIALATSATLLGALALPLTAQAQENCANRGDLDAQFCDANKDLVADTPTDPKKLKNPSTIVFTWATRG